MSKVLAATAMAAAVATGAAATTTALSVATAADAASAAASADAAASVAAEVALNAWLQAGASPLFWPAIVLLALLAGYSIYRTAGLEGNRWVGTLTAAVFGLWVVFFWE